LIVVTNKYAQLIHQGLNVRLNSAHLALMIPNKGKFNIDTSLLLAN